MTTEEKAKAYDKALEWMRKVYPTLTGADKEDAEHYFPELKESEDERIRKELWEYFHELELGSDRDFSPSLTIDDILAWLEKQKEQKPEAKLTGWVARDKDYNPYYGLGLVLFNEKPRRCTVRWDGTIASQLSSKLFPDLKWEDEPVEVEVTIKKKITPNYDEGTT